MHLTHRNNQTLWDEIACQRGHSTHRTRTVPTDRGYPLVIFDWQSYDTDGAYCPAHDLISRTIDRTSVWEEQESELVERVVSSPEPGCVIDLGAQIGWFSALALSHRRAVHAIDADPEPLRLLAGTACINGWTDLLTVTNQRIGPTTSELGSSTVRFAKLDLEGAEDQGIRILWPLLVCGLIDHILMEISPCFATYYPALLLLLADLGYVVSVVGRDEPMNAEQIRTEVPTWHQRNVWLRAKDASW